MALWGGLLRRTGMGTDQLGVGKDELFGQDTVQLLWDISMEMSITKLGN